MSITPSPQQRHSHVSSQARLLLRRELDHLETMPTKTLLLLAAASAALDTMPEIV